MSADLARTAERVERAQRVLTPAELQAWLPYHRGMSQRSIAAWLGITRSSVRDRLEGAERKLAEAEVEAA